MTKAVYDTKDICELYGCNGGDIPMLIKVGTIPKPLPVASAKGKKRWIKAKVDRHLGIDKKENISPSEITAIAKQVALLLKCIDSDLIGHN